MTGMVDAGLGNTGSLLRKNSRRFTRPSPFASTMSAPAPVFSVLVKYRLRHVWPAVCEVTVNEVESVFAPSLTVRVMVLVPLVAGVMVTVRAMPLPPRTM